MNIEHFFPFLNGINDLTNNFYLYMIILKREVLEKHALPTFNPFLYGGRTLLGDPFNMMYYPPNWLYIILPFTTATIVNILIHLIILGSGTYLLLRRGFNIRRNIAFLVAVICVLWPKWFFHLAVGHLVLLQSLSWFPFLFLIVLLIFDKNYQYKFKHALFFSGLALFSFHSSNFFFLNAAIFIFLFSLIVFFTNRKNIKTPEILKFGLCSGVIFSIFSFFQVIPEAGLAFQANRSEASISGILPLWSYKNIIASMFFPYIKLITWDVEQFIYIGPLFFIIAVLGIIKTNIKYKIPLFISLIVMVLITFNYKTPFFRLFQLLPGVSIIRVTSRFWIFVYFVLIIFFANFLKKINTRVVIIIIILIVVDYVYIDISKLTSQNIFGDQKDSPIYSFLKKNYSGKKIYTTGPFLSQYYVGVYDLRLVAGESSWQEISYMTPLKKAGGYPWFVEFAVIYPPYQAENARSQPSAKLLCRFEGQVVLSRYGLTDKSFKYIGRIDKINVYENPCAKY